MDIISKQIDIFRSYSTPLGTGMTQDEEWKTDEPKMRIKTWKI